MSASGMALAVGWIFNPSVAQVGGLKIRPTADHHPDKAIDEGDGG
jgi:hypothetical protein